MKSFMWSLSVPRLTPFQKTNWVGVYFIKMAYLMWSSWNTKLAFLRRGWDLYSLALSLSEPVANTEVALCDFCGTKCHRASAWFSCDFRITNTAAMLGGSQEAKGQAARGCSSHSPSWCEWTREALFLPSPARITKHRLSFFFLSATF